MTARLALVDGWLLQPDGRTGPAGTLVLENGLITAIGEAPPPGAEVIDCAGHTVLPGLVDAHCHLTLAGAKTIPPHTADVTTRAVHNLAALLQAGVTTVRDVGGCADVTPALRRALLEGLLHGPALEVANQIICATGGHGSESGAPRLAREADGPDEVRRAVREQLKAGASLIKVAVNGASGRVELTDHELTALVDEAHRHGLRVACHASVREAVEAAVSAGVDTVEHGNGLDATLAHRMAETGTVLVPTLSVFRLLHEAVRAGDTLGFPADLRDQLLAATEQRLADHRTAMTAAVEAGVTIATGTDRVQGQAIAAIVDELEAMLDHGLSVAQTLRATTAGGAAALGMTDRGELAEGLRADVLVVPGRLEDDLAPLRTPRMVIVGGRLHRLDD